MTIQQQERKKNRVLIDPKSIQYEEYERENVKRNRGERMKEKKKGNKHMREINGILNLMEEEWLKI